METILYLLNFHQPVFLKICKILKQSERTAVDLSYVVHGPSAAQSQQHIIVLHGLLGSKRNWRNMCKQINAATQACVIAADARNHGESPHGDTHSYQELSSDVARLMSKLGIIKAHLIGHSMGGRTAMTLALSEPSKVASLIIADISPTSSISLRNDFFPNLLKTMKSVNFHGADSLPKARTAVKEAFEAKKFKVHPDTMYFILSNLGHQSDKSYGWSLNVNVLLKDFHHIASFPEELMSKKFTGPVLFVAGGQSEFVPKGDEPKIRKLFPELELKYIEHVGHNVHAEDPKAFFDIIKPFLERVVK